MRAFCSAALWRAHDDMEKLYLGETLPVKDYGTGKMSPMVEKIGQLHFDGNITPHCWYQSPLLQNDKGKPNLVAITLLADLVYWYRPTVVRDEVSGQEVGRRQKFSADKLQKNYEKWGAGFGLTKRQVEDAMAYLKAKGLVTVEVRAVVSEYGTFPNCAFIEPVFDAIQEMTFPSPEKTGDRPRKNGVNVPKKRGTSPEKTGEPGLKNGRRGTEKRGHTKTPSETSPETKTENLPPQASPQSQAARSPKGMEEDFIGLEEAKNSDSEGDNASDKEAARVDAMLAQIMKITQTSIEIEDMRPFALECARREHKDAWKHTVALLKNKMACDKKPVIPNRYAWTVLKKALQSPCTPAASPRPSAARQEPPVGIRSSQDDVQAYYDALGDVEREALDDEVRLRVKPDLRKIKGIVKAKRDELISERLTATAT